MILALEAKVTSKRSRKRSDKTRSQIIRLAILGIPVNDKSLDLVPDYGSRWNVEEKNFL